MSKQTPRLVCSKKSIIHVVVQITHLSKIYTNLNFYRIKQGKYFKVFFKQWWNSFYAIKTSPRETEAGELDSFALITPLFHVELLSVNSFYCMVLLLSAPSYNLFYRSCGSQTWNFTSSSHSLHFHRRVPPDSSCHSTQQIFCISINERLDLTCL